MIAGNLSRFSSANNHLIGEAAGVLRGGIHLAAVAADAPTGANAAATILEEECHRAERARRRQSRTGLRAIRPSCSISC